MTEEGGVRFVRAGSGSRTPSMTWCFPRLNGGRRGPVGIRPQLPNSTVFSGAQFAEAL